MKKFIFFKRKTSGSIARERLKILLLSDRMNFTSDITEKIQRDLIRCISKYLDVDEKGMQISFEPPGKNQEADSSCIKATIPVRNMKQRR